MSEDTQSSAVEPVEAPDTQQQTTGEPTSEERALNLGWAPKDKWRGDPDKWVDAETFVGRIDKSPALAAAEVKRLERKLADMENTMKAVKAHFTRAEAKAYERARADLEARMEQAVEQGDKDAYRAARTEAAALDKETRAELEDQGVKVPPASPQYVMDWINENPWFKSDPDMNAYAMGIEAYVEKRGFSGKAALMEIARMTKAQFPEKFTNPARSQPAAVGTSGHAQGGGKTYANLPAEAKAECDKAVKMNMCTREEYVKYYDWS